MTATGDAAASSTPTTREKATVDRREIRVACYRERPLLT